MEEIELQRKGNEVSIKDSAEKMQEVSNRKNATYEGLLKEIENM